MSRDPTFSCVLPFCVTLGLFADRNLFVPQQSGYYKDEKNTKEALDDEGWLHTGDVCSVDSVGRFKVRLFLLWFRPL